MSNIKFSYPPGATPLDPNETVGLIPTYITTQAELNELEGKNIESAVQWFSSKRQKDILNPTFVFELHKQMFGDVWRWAGKQRTSNKNIGCMWEQVPTKLAQLLQDVKFWLENNTYPIDEIAVRFHFRLVAIHAFSNGNGRHGRLMTDILLEIHGQVPFTWGSKTDPTPLEVESRIRKDYIAALNAADRGSVTELLNFARS